MTVIVQVAFSVALLLVIAAIYSLFRRTPAVTPADGPAVEPGEIVTLRTYADRHEADIVVGLLQTHGIAAMVGTDDGDGWRPEGLWRMARVLVRAADLATARFLIEDVDQPNGSGLADGGRV